ncbi:hypothetical protein I4U23_019988 [Adineta vaga]|nr:hypothetical protein I4U23_019988 [Adineta vaga]
MTCQLNMYNLIEETNDKSNALEYDCLDYYVYRAKLAYQHLYDITVDVIPFCFRPMHRLADDPMDSSVHPLAPLPFTRIIRAQSKEEIPFQKFCDGITHYFYYNLNRQIRTDEDGCEMNKVCDNIYARCDGYWACSDGRDESNCSQSLCPPKHHPCISPDNYTMFCLPHTLVNDGRDDCLGATDEQIECRERYYSNEISQNLRCLNDSSCLKSSELCDKTTNCPVLNDDEAFCQDSQFTFTCEQNGSYHRNEIEQILCGLNEHDKYRYRFFTLITSPVYPSSISSHLTNEINYHLQAQEEEEEEEEEEEFMIKQNTTMIEEDDQWTHYCNRGIKIEKYTNNGTFSNCLCPPSYYGDLCEYQNQRLSLSLQLSSINRYETYGIVILLIDNDEIIIEFNQLQYIAKDSCTMKFNQYLLYPTRPKNLSTNYSIRIDVIEKNWMSYIGHWYFTIPFLFLPVNRMSLSLNLSSNVVERGNQCSMECSNGQECVKYVNEEKSFCRWMKSNSGHKCSNDSIFIGKKRAKESICVCPLNEYGSNCLISSKCSINHCQNHGQCIRNDLNMFHRNYSCICPNKYYGLHCEYRKWELDVSIDEIEIPSYLIAYFYTTSNQSQPIQTIILRKLTLFQHIVTFHISIPFHLVFIQIQHDFYLVYLQHRSQMSMLTSLNPKQKCHSIDNYLNSTILQLHPYERINYFHKLCFLHWHLQCFIDKMYLCLCTNDHHANCLEFSEKYSSSQHHFQCISNDNYCLNQGECYQDHPQCPSTKICLCANCFFGQQCQLYAKGLGSTLDEILGYEFRHNKGFFSQSFSIQITACVFIIFVLPSPLYRKQFRQRISHLRRQLSSR